MNIPLFTTGFRTMQTVVGLGISEPINSRDNGGNFGMGAPDNNKLPYTHSEVGLSPS